MEQSCPRMELFEDGIQHPSCAQRTLARARTHASTVHFVHDRLDQRLMYVRRIAYWQFFDLGVAHEANRHG